MLTRWLLLLGVALATGKIWPQQLFDAAPGRSLRFHASDSAVLAGSENRKDLDCRVEPLRPRLDFDLKYTAGYVVHVPATAVAPSGEHLRVLFRVRPLGDDRAEAVYFRQSFEIPAESVKFGGTAVFQGRYFLGPGQYSVDWLMRNLQGRVCSSHWRTQAPKPGHGGRLAAAAAPHLIAPFREDTFDEEPPVARSKGVEGGLHVLLLVNLAPLDRERFRLSDYEIDSIVGMLRSLHREPSIGLFSLTAFNAYDRQIVYSAERRTKLDFPALGEAIQGMPTGVVEIDELTDPDGEQRFLAGVLNEALAPASDPPDAVVILGPKIDRDARIPEDMLEFSKTASPLFLFAFNRNPRSYPWPGAMETALQPFGLTVYGVTRPQDYTRAVTGLLDAIEGRIGSERSDGLSSP